MTRLRLLCAALALAAALALPASAGAAMAIAPSKPLSTPRPQLLLFHGGSFLYDDPVFEPVTAQWAINFGFVPHYVVYPLGDVAAAAEVAQNEARLLAERYGPGHVYAYGASAGGTLASLLASEGLVTAAVAKAPVSDLVSWEWPLGVYGPDYFAQVRLDLTGREHFSPAYRIDEREVPLLVLQGRGDRVVPLAMNQNFASTHEDVELRIVPGGHTPERRDPDVLGEAIRWLAQAARAELRAPYLD